MRSTQASYFRDNEACFLAGWRKLRKVNIFISPYSLSMPAAAAQTGLESPLQRILELAKIHDNESNDDPE